MDVCDNGGSCDTACDEACDTAYGVTTTACDAVACGTLVTRVGCGCKEESCCDGFCHLEQSQHVRYSKNKHQHLSDEYYQDMVADLPATQKPVILVCSITLYNRPGAYASIMPRMNICDECENVPIALDLSPI